MLVWLAAEVRLWPRRVDVVSGVVWQPGTPLAVEWVMRSTSNSAATRLLEGIGLNPTFGFPMIGETTNSTDLVDLTQSIAVSRSSGYPVFFTSGFVLRIAPQRSVGFSVDEPTALSFRFALATEQPSEGFDGVRWGWIPAGFWWAREAGERRSIPNPTQSEALLWVQVEQNVSSGPSIRWKMTPDQQAGRTFDVLEVFSELFADEQLQLQPWRSTYDESVFAPTLGNRLVILPSDAGSSDQATGGQSTVFTSRSCNDFELPTSLPAIQVTTAEVDCEATLVLLADDSENYWEVAASQSDGSHFRLQMQTRSPLLHGPHHKIGCSPVAQRQLPTLGATHKAEQRFEVRQGWSWKLLVLSTAQSQIGTTQIFLVESTNKLRRSSDSRSGKGDSTTPWPSGASHPKAFPN